MIHFSLRRTKQLSPLRLPATRMQSNITRLGTHNVGSQRSIIIRGMGLFGYQRLIYSFRPRPPDLTNMGVEGVS